MKLIYGSPELVCLKSEEHTRNSVRRSAVVKENIQKGEKLTWDKIIFIRPGDGLSPEETESLIGRTALNDIAVDSVLSEEMFSK